MMAETNAKREARRRRILENSESRLRKITMRNLDEIDENVQVADKEIQEKLNWKAYNIGNGISKHNIGSEENSREDAKFNEDEYEKFIYNSNTNTCLLGQISKTELILHKFLANRINFILLAGIVNILLELKLDSWFGKAVIIPYFLLMLGRLYNCKKLHKTQDNSLLVAALILCHIKPYVIHKLKIFLMLFTVILNDFGLYMFSFILIRYVITCYYNYVTIPMSV